ncbi:MAG: YggT family protein [Desulfitobacteriaceae bacterium]|nr:YggT family protein [Desulfitobacteriaceae bacterium]
MEILTYAIVIRALLSFFPHSLRQPLVQFLYKITEPWLKPFRRFQIGGSATSVDLSPLLALLVLQFIIRPLFRNLIYLLAGR